MKIGISLCLGVLMCLNAGCTGKKSAAEEPELTYSNPLSSSLAIHTYCWPRTDVIICMVPVPGL